jgi:hypothetical protein
MFSNLSFSRSSLPTSVSSSPGATVSTAPRNILPASAEVSEVFSRDLSPFRTSNPDDNSRRSSEPDEAHNFLPLITHNTIEPRADFNFNWEAPALHVPCR